MEANIFENQVISQIEKITKKFSFQSDVSKEIYGAYGEFTLYSYTIINPITNDFVMIFVRIY